MTKTARWYFLLIVTWLYVAAIFAVLPMTPDLVKAIGQIVPVGTLVNSGIVLLVVAGYIVSIYLRPGEKLRILIPFLLLTVFFGLVFSLIRIPVERIHIPEYAVLSVLFFRLLERDHTKPDACLLSFLLTATVGMVDESIQLILPNRYFDWRDIWLNVLGGFSGLLTLGYYRWLKS